MHSSNQIDWATDTYYQPTYLPINFIRNWAVVVAKLAQRPLSILEFCSLNPDIGKIYNEILFTVNCIEKTKINKKRPGMAHCKKHFAATDRVSLLLAMFAYQTDVGNKQSSQSRILITRGFGHVILTYLGIHLT